MEIPQTNSIHFFNNLSSLVVVAPEAEAIGFDGLEEGKVVKLPPKELAPPFFILMFGGCFAVDLLTLGD